MNHQVIYDSFEAKVFENPNAPAVLDEQRQLTRSELSRLADAIASQLPAHAGRVGVVMDHSAAMIAAILAVLKTGAAYIPAEPTLPQNRIQFMMEDAGADCVIANPHYADILHGFPLIPVDAGMQIQNMPVKSKAAPDDLAYILYTSGSTGVPKGVAVQNRNVCHYVRAFQNEFHPGKQDTVLQYSVCSFDIFVEEVFPALLSGARLAIPSEKTKANLKSVMEFTRKNHVTIISGFPYLLLEMNRLPELPESLRLLISGGDVLRAGYITNLLPQVEVYNTYGPSETTVCATYFKCNGAAPLADGTYPIGKAVLGCGVKILDETLNPLPPGRVGEICIAGGGVSQGYIGSREKENQSFVILPDGQRLYRSGDLGYLLPDGNLAFLHRKDKQVMILGKRVEPDEVESVLCNCPGVRQGAVQPYMDEQHLSYLVAYIVPEDHPLSINELRGKMWQHLPAYMIPEFFVQMRRMPLTPNGKIDVDALPVVLKAGDLQNPC